MIRKMWCLCLVVVCPAICACTPSSPHQETTYPVSGTVTLDGQPLAEGQVHFVNREEATVDRVPIQNGKFEGQAKAGKRRVEITAYREGPPEPSMPGMDPEPTQVNYIPARYNADSELTAEVTKDASKNQFTFELVSEAGKAPEKGEAESTSP